MKKLHLITCLALLSIFLVHSPAHAGTFTAFGPKTFIRGNGSPVVETASFSIKNPNTAYTLRVHNGGTNSEYSKVSSAIIKLNGTTIFDTSNFNQQASTLQKQIAVSDTNQLQVELRSAPGSGLNVIIEGEDDTPPSVIINSPVNGAYTNSQSISVSGTASDSISWINTLTINGTSASLSGETFTSKIQLTEGVNIITVAATDAAGNTENASVSVILDTTPPKITFEPVPSITNKPQLTITGKVEDASLLTVLTINGTPTTLSNNTFAAAVNLTEGNSTILIIATDKAGNTSRSSIAVNLDTTAPAITITFPTNGSSVNTGTITVIGTIDDNTAIVSVNGINATVSNNSFTSSGIPLTKGANTVTITATDSLGNAASTQITVTYSLPGVPDPATVAPPVDNTVATTLASATSFLYSGQNPIQTGVAPGTIEAKRVAVLRGKVTAKDGTPLSGVKITIRDHAEFGSTQTHEDGTFDMAVNGGGWLTVNYEKNGYLPVQRKVDAPWQDYAWLDDVVMIPYDSKVTTIDLNANVPIQVAQGSTVTDNDGTRKATLLFPQGIYATMQLSDGSWLSLSNASIRATEYTVGEDGPKAMPGPLPPTSGYTYAVELSLDEAVTMGAKYVSFSKPVITYVENFLNFPVGGIVPVGWYDREKGAWIPSDNGRIIKILSITNGLADIDVNGSNTPATSSALSALGITDAERQTLATLYQPGQSLWRVPITHLTPWDCNWPYGPPQDATPPQQPQPEFITPIDNPCTQRGSIIECQNQTLGEIINISGTPFSLNYRSDRVPGRKAAYTINIPISGATLPSSLKRIDLEIEIAGRKFTQTFNALPNQAYSFTWDGMDAYNRKFSGAQPVTIRIGYAYQAVYQEPANFAQSFGAASGLPITGNRARQEVTIWQESKASIGQWDSMGQKLGWWMLNVQHSYDAVSRILYLGDGTKHSADNIGNVITTVAGNGSGGYSGDGGPATAGKLHPYGVAVDSIGNLFIADTYNNRIRKVNSNGIITTVAGNGSWGYSGDGGPAISASLKMPLCVAVDSQGNLFIGDFGNKRVRKVDSTGIITTVAGNGLTWEWGDPARRSASLSSITGITIDNHGNLFIVDHYTNRILKVSTSGILTQVAGSGVYGFGFSGDGGLATSARINYPYSVAVDNQGDLFIADMANHRIRKVTPGGIITTVAGDGSGGYSGDGGPATSARLYAPYSVAVDGQGNIFIADAGNQRIRKITSDGVITTVAGNGASGYSGDSGHATRSTLNSPLSVVVDHQGNLFIADVYNSRIRKVAPSFPGFSGQDIVIPSEDGKELYGFDANGRHLNTVDATTGTTIYTFTYNTAGYLTSVSDIDGNITTIERDSTGNPTAIIAPGGQRTELTLDANGYLASVTNPKIEAHQMTYTSDGLLTSFTKPKGSTSTFTYDDLGLLIKDEDTAGGFKALSRTEGDDSYTVAVSTAEGITNSYAVESLSTGDTKRTNTDPNGLKTVTQIGTNGTTTSTAPDGTVTTTTEGPDPRFGMQAHITTSKTIKTPGGLTYTYGESRTVSLSDSNNPLSIITMTDTKTVNGKAFTNLYEAATRKITATTPLGRKRYTLQDAKGRVAQEQITGLEVANYQYDEKGRVTGISQGTRTATIAYDSLDQVSSITDAVGRSVSFAYDLAGRVTQQTLPDNRVIAYSYDANGNVTSITPPGRPAHTFTYDPRDLETYYLPPSPLAGEGGGEGYSTQYAYNLDKQLTLITRPDGQTISLNYDNGGRVSTMVLPTGQLTYSYNSTTGNLSSVAAPGESLSYTFDGSLLTGQSWSGAVTGSVGFSYNKDFRITSETVNGGNSVSYSYDNDGLLTSAGSLSISHDSQNGLITGSTLGSVSDTFSYSSFGEPSRYTASVSGSTLLDVQYTRDNLGRITSKTETVSGTTSTYAYTYDQAGRLTDVTKNGTNTAHYDYDQNGNRVGWAAPTGSGTAVYDNQDRLVSYGNASYTYTANGELQSKTTSGQSTTYNYDVLGNLKSAALSDGTAIEYVVDGQNRRIGKKVNGILVQGFLYQNQLRPVAELDGAGNVVSRFVYGTKVNVPDFMIKGGVTYRIITDHLGSPRLIVNASTGAIAQQIDYDEFGNVIQDTNPDFTPFGFAGGLYDRDTMLTRFGARDYDAKTGKWSSRDPLKFAGGDTNLLNYVGNNPVVYNDPEGLFTPFLGAGIGAISAATSAYFSTKDVPYEPRILQISQAALIGGATGFITGAVPFGSSFLINSLVGGTISVSGDIIGQKWSDPCGKLNTDSLVVSGLAGMLGGGAGNLLLKGGMTAADATVFGTALTAPVEWGWRMSMQ